MKTYKVYEAEQKTTTTGKQLKKLVLQGEGMQYPMKNVTIWGDNPLFAQAVAGGTITCDILESDSGNLNPKSGKNYVNRTVANPDNPTPVEPNTNEMGVKSYIDTKMQPIIQSLKRIEDHLGTTPQPTVGNTSMPYPQDEGYSEDIKPEDIPF